MPKAFLREPFAALELDICATSVHLTHSDGRADIAALARALMRKYEMKLRPVPLDTREIEEHPHVCPICRKELGDSVVTIQRFDETRQTYAHPGCVNRPQEGR